MTEVMIALIAPIVALVALALVTEGLITAAQEIIKFTWKATDND